MSNHRWMRRRSSLQFIDWFEIPFRHWGRRVDRHIEVLSAISCVYYFRHFPVDQF